MNNTEAIRNLSKNIHDLRCEKNLSAEQLAQTLDLTTQQLEMLGNGALPENLTVESLLRLEKKCGISLKDLFL